MNTGRRTAGQGVPPCSWREAAECAQNGALQILARESRWSTGGELPGGAQMQMD